MRNYLVFLFLILLNFNLHADQSTLVFKAYKKPISVVSENGYTLKISPYSLSYMDSEGKWDVTDAAEDDYENSTVSSKIGLFDWSLDFTKQSGSGGATINSTIYVQFSISGALINQKDSSKKIDYDLEVYVNPTKVELEISSNTYTCSLSTLSSSRFEGSFTTTGSSWRSTTYSLRDTIGSTLSLRSTTSYYASLTSSNSLSNRFSFTPTYKTGNSYNYRNLGSMNNSYSIVRGGTGYIILNREDYEVAKESTGLYLATITVTMSVS
jgi:hypothetical protein